jgi:hypothetical protein
VSIRHESLFYGYIGEETPVVYASPPDDRVAYHNDDRCPGTQTIGEPAEDIGHLYCEVVLRQPVWLAVVRPSAKL